MHEMSIMQNILDIVAETTAREQGARVTRIDLAIGERAGVMIEALTFAFEAMSPRTIAAGAKLMITEIPLRYQCPTCARQGTEQTSQCPACDSLYELVQGRELQITAIEIE